MELLAPDAVLCIKADNSPCATDTEKAEPFRAESRTEPFIGFHLYFSGEHAGRAGSALADSAARGYVDVVPFCHREQGFGRVEF